MKLYRGTKNGLNKRIGMCLTNDIGTAEAYAGSRGKVVAVELPMAGLHVVRVADYDRESNVAVGDDGETLDCDIVVYDDEDPCNRSHRTWRIMSQAALDLIVVIESDDDE